MISSVTTQQDTAMRKDYERIISDEIQENTEATNAPRCPVCRRTNCVSIETDEEYEAEGGLYIHRVACYKCGLRSFPFRDKNDIPAMWRQQ